MVSTGSVYLAGSGDGGGSLNGYLWKYNSAGAEAWTRLLGTSIKPDDINGPMGVIYLAC